MHAEILLGNYKKENNICLYFNRDMKLILFSLTYRSKNKMDKNYICTKMQFCLSRLLILAGYVAIVLY